METVDRTEFKILSLKFDKDLINSSSKQKNNYQVFSSFNCCRPGIFEFWNQGVIEIAVMSICHKVSCDSVGAKKKMATTPPAIIKLNIGGTKFQTTASTLLKYPDSFFGGVLSGKFAAFLDEEGAYFIDRDGKYFEPILQSDSPP